MAEALRLQPLDGLIFAGNGTTLTPLDARERIVLRADEKTAKKLGLAIGLDLPLKPGATHTRNNNTALWIGPDEWLLIGSLNAKLEAALGKVKNQTFSAVPVSHRNTAIIVSGPNAANTLNSGCPRDLSLDGFPEKTCSRTIFGKAEIILWRTGAQEFHVECWRSFSDYVWKFLVDAARSA